MATLVDVNQLAKALNRQPRRVQQLIHEGMPKGERGKYDLGACMLWYIRYLQNALESKAVEGPSGELVNMHAQKIRGLRADADMKEIELAIKRGQFVNIADVRACLSDLVLMTKARLLSVPPRLSTEVIGETSMVMIQAKIERAIKDSLSQLADDGSNYPSRQ